jgi:hypothetical protein
VYTIEGEKIVRMQVFGEDRDAAWAAFNEASSTAYPARERGTPA